MIVLRMEQGTPEWFQARLGIPTASCFHKVMAKGEGKVRRAYMLELAGERVSQRPAEGFSTPAMERGKALEAEARDMYAFIAPDAVEEVGFCVRQIDRTNIGMAGASPDAFVGVNGLLEIKTRAPHLMVDLILRASEEPGYYPPEHRAQVQGGLWITDRDWCDLICYYPGMPLFLQRVHRDDTYIAVIAAEIDKFNEELDRMEHTVRTWGREMEARGNERN